MTTITRPVRSGSSPERVLSRGRLVGASLAITLLLLILLATLAISTATSQLRSAAEKQVRTNAALSAQVIADDAGRLQELASEAARDPRVVAALRDGDARSLTPILAQLQKRSGGSTTAVVDPQGRVIASNTPTAGSTVTSDASRDWFQHVIQGYSPYLSATFLSRAKGHPTVNTAAAAIRPPGVEDATATGEGSTVATSSSLAAENRGKPLLGIVAINERALQQSFLDQFAKEQGVALAITDAAGTLVARSNAAPNGQLVSLHSDPDVRAALAGHTVVDRITQAGTAYVAAYAPVPQIGWTVQALERESTAFRPIAHLRVLVIVITAIIGTLLVGVLVVLNSLLRTAEDERVASERSQQALELNDNIVQSLTVAQLALALDRPEQASAAVDGALAASKRIVSSLLDAEHGDRPSLTRSTSVRADRTD